MFTQITEDKAITAQFKSSGNLKGKRETKKTDNGGAKSSG